MVKVAQLGALFSTFASPLQISRLNLSIKAPVERMESRSACRILLLAQPRLVREADAWLTAALLQASRLSSIFTAARAVQAHDWRRMASPAGIPRQFRSIWPMAVQSS